MIIRYMTSEDRAFVKTLRDHATDEQFALRMQARNGYVLEEGGIPIGIMHHCIFWDSLPLMNLIHISPRIIDAKDMVRTPCVSGKRTCAVAVIRW